MVEQRDTTPDIITSIPLLLAPFVLPIDRANDHKQQKGGNIKTTTKRISGTQRTARYKHRNSQVTNLQQATNLLLYLRPSPPTPYEKSDRLLFQQRVGHKHKAQLSKKASYCRLMLPQLYILANTWMSILIRIGVDRASQSAPLHH